jgi:hypothetical protein
MALLEMQIALAWDVSITGASHSDPPGLFALHRGYLVGDFVLIRCGEHPSALAFASNETERQLTARFQRLRDRDLSLMAFDDSWILRGKMSKRLDVASEFAMWSMRGVVAGAGERLARRTRLLMLR